MSQTAAAPLPPPATRQRSAISWRSVTLGLLGTVIVCGITPYNDNALNNTAFVGNNLPLGVVVMLFLLALVVNGPLSKWAPKYALTTGELAIALAMVLVSCALPSSGLMRYFPNSLVIPLWHARGVPEWQEMLESLKLKEWIWPSFTSGDGPRQWMNDPIVEGYYRRWDPERGPVPYGAWLRPAVFWGIFIFSLYGALLCMAALVRRQWNENERLPFPLAQIQLALIEQPKPGNFLNSWLSKPGFWIAFVTIFFIRVWNGSATYWPRYFPPIPVSYDLSSLFTEPPLSYVDWPLQRSQIYFIVAGVTYFISTPVAFSLWFFMVLEQLYRVIKGVSPVGDPLHYGSWEEHQGGVIAFALVILWVGRNHWRLILHQAFRGEREGEPRGRYLPYRTAFWGLVTCTIIMIAWLTFVGCTMWGAVVMVLLLLMLFLVFTRIIAETGLVYGQMLFPIYKPWQLAAIYGWSKPVSVETVYMSGLLQVNYYDFREPVSVYATHGMKLTDDTVLSDVTDDRRARRTGWKIIGLMALTLAIAYVVSLASTLWTEYRYGVTLDAAQREPINGWGSGWSQMGYVLMPTNEYAKGNYNVPYSPLGHMGAGFGITALLGFLRLRFGWWPLHPVGFIMLPTTPAMLMWFSIFLGWLCKVLVVRFGGGSMYQNAKPIFLGLIVGDSVAAGFWLILNIILSFCGVAYKAVNIMPG